MPSVLADKVLEATAALVAVLSVAGLLVAAQVEQSSEPTSRLLPMEFLKKGEPAPDFELIDHHEQPIRLQDLRGTPIILTFFHTSCRDYCPLILKGRARLEASARKVVGDAPFFLAITMDPETDTPEVLRRYIETLGLDPERLHLLTGQPEEVRRVLQAYHIHTIKGSDSDVITSHTMVAYAIDADGIIQQVLVFNFGPSRLGPG
ncbi:MAG: SCO family protein [Nitrospirae bacterium]|nr:MAG: SCO family protein [Nitrospirota bacterium]